VSLQIYILKKKGIKEITEENLGVTQTKTVTCALNKTELIEKLKNDPIFGKMKMAENENGIVLKTGMTWKSWGEEIKILLKQDNKADFEYQISSSPKLKTTLVDYEKNLENLNQIENMIKNIP
jgi:hypothetical protein